MRSRMSERDDGFALPLVLGVIAVITAVSVTGYAVASQTLHNSSRVSNQNLAFQAASTGLETEISFFSPQNMAQYPKVANLSATDSYEVDVQDIGGGVYEMRSRGTSNGQQETVVTRFQYLDLWDMNISGGDQSAVGVRNGFNGNSTVIGALYVNGNIDWGANGRMWGGPVFVKDGTWNASGNGQVGDSTNRVPAYGPVPSDNSRYFTDLRGSAPELEIPTLTDANMAAYLTKAQQTAARFPRTTPLSGTQPANQDVTYYTVFNGNTTFNSAFGDPTVGTGDAIAVSGNTLYIQDGAVIYVNGTATFGSNIQYYYGNGIIVAKNGFVINGDLKPANGLSEVLYGKTVWKMDARDCLGLLSQGDVTFAGNWLCVAMFINGNYNVPNNAHNNFRGSIICNSLNIQTTNTLLCTQPGLSGLFANGGQDMPQLSGFTARSDWIRR